MKNFEVRIRDKDVSIHVAEELFDAQGNPVNIRKNISAVGLGDFAADPSNPTEAEVLAFRNEVESVTQDKIGPQLAQTIAEYRATLDALQAENEALKAEIERLTK